MTDNKTLIAYGTRMGAAEEAASEIANVLRGKYGFDVGIVNLKKISVLTTSAPFLRSSSYIVFYSSRLSQMTRTGLPNSLTL